MLVESILVVVGVVTVVLVNGNKLFSKFKVGLLFLEKLTSKLSSASKEEDAVTGIGVPIVEAKVDTPVVEGILDVLDLISVDKDLVIVEVCCDSLVTSIVFGITVVGTVILGVANLVIGFVSAVV